MENLEKCPDWRQEPCSFTLFLRECQEVRVKNGVGGPGWSLRGQSQEHALVSSSSGKSEEHVSKCHVHEWRRTKLGEKPGAGTREGNRGARSAWQQPGTEKELPRLEFRVLIVHCVVRPIHKESAGNGRQQSLVTSVREELGKFTKWNQTFGITTPGILSVGWALSQECYHLLSHLTFHRPLIHFL